MKATAGNPKADNSKAGKSQAGGKKADAGAASASGKLSEKAIRRASPAAMSTMPFAAGSMGPRVDAACRFASATGKRAAIGALADLGRIIAGEAGTTNLSSESGIVYAAS